MAAPSYTEDLTDVNLAETTTGWSAYGGGASGLAQNPDSSMQGTYGVGKQITNADKGQYFDNGSTITLGTGAHVYVWLFCTTPGLTNTIQNKGTSIYIGTTSANYCQYHVEGNDTYGAAGRVGKCYPIDYTVRSTNASAPYRTASGTPGANPQLFGGGLVTTAAVKGENVVIDAIRYGSGAYLTAGELISAGDGSDNPATFSGFQAQNDTVTNRWGILTLVAGSYELQGKFVIGQNNAKTATLCRFKDSNKTVNFANTIHAASTFNEIIIDHASTRVEWDNINLTALGTTAPGALTVNSANPTVIINGGTFQGIGATTLRSNSTITGATWLGSGQITANTAVIDSCVISNYSGASNTSALVWNTATNPSGYLDDNRFVKGSGTTHAIEFGTSSPTTLDLSGITFSGYNASNNQNDSAIHFKRTAGTVTVNLSGMSTPSYRTDGATITFVNAVTVTLSGLPTGVEVRVYEDSGSGVAGTEINGIENTTGSTFAFATTGGTDVIITIFDEDYDPVRILYTVPGSDTTLPFTLISDGVYLNPTSGGVFTYYFDGSDAAASDSGSDWSNVTNADDGSTATVASNSTTSSSILKIEGTNAPASGATITQVRARVYGSLNSGTINEQVLIKTDGGSETLATITDVPSTSGWSSYATLSTPTGGWTWAKIQALESEARIVIRTSGSFDLAKIEIEVTSS